MDEKTKTLVDAFCEGAEFAMAKIEAGDSFERNWALTEALNRYNYGNPAALPAQTPKEKQG